MLNRNAMSLAFVLLGIMCSSCDNDQSEPSPAATRDSVAEADPTEHKRVFTGKASLTTPEDVERLKGYTKSENSVSITGAGLNTLDGLKSLRWVEGLSIWSSQDLVNLEGLHNLEHIDWAGLTVNGNKSLKSLHGLRGLRRVESLAAMIIGNTRLTTLGRWEHDVYFKGDIEISANTNLEDISALRGATLGGSYMKEHPNGLIEIANNPKLPRKHIDEVIATFDYDGDFRICGNKNDDPCEE